MKKNAWIMFLILLPVLICAVDSAEDTGLIKLDVESAVALALENNLTVKNNRLDVENTTLSLANIWNQFIPGASLSASVGQRQGTAGQDTADSNSLNLGFHTSLTINVTMFYNARQCVLDYQSGKITLERAKAELSYNVKKAYYNLVLLKEQTDLLRKQIEKSKSAYELALLKYNKGMISEVDKLKSEYSYLSLVPEYSTMQNEFTAALLSFKQMLGIKSDDDIEFTDVIPEIGVIDYEKVAKLSVTNNPDIQVLIQNLKSDENSISRQMASLIPSISLSYSCDYSFAEDITRADWFAADNWNNTGSLSLSVSLPLDPLFPYSSAQIEIEKSRNNVLKRQNEIQNLIEQIQIDVLTDLLKLKQIENYLDTLTLNVDIAEKTFRLAEQSYNAGIKGYLDLQDAENNLFEAKLKLLDARYQYIITCLDLKYLLNVENF